MVGEGEEGGEGGKKEGQGKHERTIRNRMNYYNEIDPFAAQWIRNLIDSELIPPGDVDTRSIKEVMPDDIQGYTQCHWFAGIAGWSLALELAGVAPATPVWTGSCPCQPYSAAGKGRGDSDERNLWPEFYRLIRERRPECVIGEQVENAIGHGWLDGVSADLEREGYAIGAIVLGAHSAGAPHIRQRLYWGGKRVADASPTKLRRRLQSKREHRGAFHVADGGSVERVADANQERYDRRKATGRGYTNHAEQAKADTQCVDGLGDTSDTGLQERDGERDIQPGTGCAPQGQATELRSPWSNYHIIPCRDNKARRISAEPGDEPLATGIPRDLGRGESKLRRMAIRAARANRVGRLKGYGNAICPQTAAEFIKAFFEAGT